MLQDRPGKTRGNRGEVLNPEAFTCPLLLPPLTWLENGIFYHLSPIEIKNPDLTDRVFLRGGATRLIANHIYHPRIAKKNQGIGTFLFIFSELMENIVARPGFEPGRVLRPTRLAIRRVCRFRHRATVDVSSNELLLSSAAPAAYQVFFPLSSHMKPP